MANNLELPANFTGSTSAYQLGINGNANFTPYELQGITLTPSFWDKLGNNISNGISSLGFLFNNNDNDNDNNNNNNNNNGNGNGSTLQGIGNVVQGISGLYNAWNQNKLAKQYLNQMKQQFAYNVMNNERNYQAGRKTYNNNLAQVYESAATQNTGNRHAYDNIINERSL